MLHCRSESSRSSRDVDVRRYSRDQFESVADQTTTGDAQSYDKLQSPAVSAHKADRSCKHSGDITVTYCIG